MNITDYVGSLEEVSTPVIILDSEGRVIYKNTSAIRSVRLPRRNTHIFAHLDKTGIGEYEKIQKRRKPSVITVNTGDRNARAFVSKYTRDGEDCSIWIFVSHLQTGATSRVFNQIESSINLAAGEICDIVKEIDRRGRNLNVRMKGAADKKISKSFFSLIDRIYKAETDPRASMYAVDKAVEILTGAAERTLSHFGFRARIDRSGMGLPMGYLVDYRAFSSAFTHLLVFAAEASASKAIEVTCSFEDESIVTRMGFTLPIPPEYVSGEKDVSKLVHICPASTVDIIVFEKVCKSFGYDFEFSVTEDFIDNVSIVFKAPCSSLSMVRASSAFDIESILLEKDQSVIFAYVFSEIFDKNYSDEY